MKFVVASNCGLRAGKAGSPGRRPADATGVANGTGGWPFGWRGRREVCRHVILPTPATGRGEEEEEEEEEG